MMDGRFSADLRGALALAPGVMPSEPFIRTPGLVARAADGFFTSRGLRDLAVPLDPAEADAPEVETLAPEAAPQALPDPLPVPVTAAQPVMPAPAPQHGVDLAALRAQARREAQDELATARAALQQDAQRLATALARIAQPPAADLAALTAHLGRAVAHLAAERAGQAIDAEAAPFVRRILDLAERVTTALDRVTLRLHPDDCTAVNACLSGACPADLVAMAQARLRPDPGLLRGDVALQADGLWLEDLILPPAEMPRPEERHND